MRKWGIAYKNRRNQKIFRDEAEDMWEVVVIVSMEEWNYSFGREDIVPLFRGWFETIDVKVWDEGED